MWELNWEGNKKIYKKSDDLNYSLVELNKEYKNIRPIFAQISNQDNDCMYVAIGNPNGYSFIDYISSDGLFIKHVEGENYGDETVCFYVEDSESEFYIEDTIMFETALKIINEFICNNKLAEFVNWIDD